MFNKMKVKELIGTTNNLSKGTYNGVVVDRNDSQKYLRVKVSIFNLTEGIDKSLLPWYTIKHKVSSSPNASGSIPPLGSEVVVEFPDDDIYNGKVSYLINSRPPT